MTRLILIAALLPVLAGCSQGGVPPPGPGSEVVAVGVLASVEDAVPVDGGLTLEVRSDEGAVTAFVIPSFFTAEPVPEGRWELYEHVKTFTPGTRVRATGTREDPGILLTGLESLEP